MPVMLLLLFGIIDFGRVLQQQLLLTEAVREGARVGALNGNAATMQGKVNTIVGAGANLTFTTTSPCTPSSTATSDSTVSAKRTFVPITPLVAFMQYFGGSAVTITISATGAMGCMG